MKIYLNMIDAYWAEMEECIEKGRAKKEKDVHEETDELWGEERQVKINKKPKIERDKKGRLKKGSLLAKKDNCSEAKILLWYRAGVNVKDIVKHLGCSKSTVYRIISKHK